MKLWFALLHILFCVCASKVQAQLINSLDDIEYWVGLGANRSALVIDFHDGTGKQSFAWGYYYDGIKTGADMLLAISAADLNLTLTYSGSAEDNLYLMGISYFDGSTTHTRDNGDFISDSNYWGYYLAGGTAGETLEEPFTLIPVTVPASLSLPSTWEVAATGPSAISFNLPGRYLANNSWDAWSYGENGTTPLSEVYAAAVPEPSTWALLGGAALAFGIWRIRRAKCCV
jgi:hypothetical protein